MKEKAVVLLSGGIDSTTTLYLAKKRGFNCFCLTFNYGQGHKKEVDLAKGIARFTGSKYTILNIALPWKGSSLIDRRLKIPRRTAYKDMGSRIPSTYVPSRNTIFLSYAASFAETAGAENIFIGANIIDYSGYPDCRPEYIREFNGLLNFGTKNGKIKVKAPLIRKSKCEIIKLGNSLGVPFDLTWSCYEGMKRPCGTCDSCKIRANGFREAGLADPLWQ